MRIGREKTCRFRAHQHTVQALEGEALAQCHLGSLEELTIVHESQKEVAEPM